MESLARGGTRWKRFAVVMVPSVAATAAIGVALSQGALAASFSVSGQQFKVTASHLVGEDFVQYGAADTTSADEKKPVAVVGFKSAEITNLCQSVVVPVPLFGDMTMKLEAGEQKPVEAKTLYIDADDLHADAEFTNIDIGVDVDKTKTGPSAGDKVKGKYKPGSFAQQADHVVFDNVEQRAWATTAGTFTLKGLHMAISQGSKEECKLKK
ncbi:DUF6230 family protein [Streptomyces varsoviensis]|uniref:DUF6230 family protein n=1 Tax=Streptomyces varsoviensis TaxID=67373 RepID=UPI0033C3DED2